MLEVNCKLQITVGTAEPQPLSARSEWALLDPNLCQISVGPDLNCDAQIAVDTARHQTRAPDLGGHCWTALPTEIGIE